MTTTTLNKDFIGEELILSLKDDNIDISWDVLKEARKGNGDILFAIGCTYYSEKNDYTKALAWYRKAALKKNNQAQCNIGYMYNSGQGVSVDYKLAMDWYLKAAENGNDMAKNNIGWLYQHGLGVEVDYQLAKKWYLEAINDGSDIAKSNVGVMYRDGLGVSVDHRLAMAYFQEANKNGIYYAKWNIGWMYHKGYSVPVDYDLAMEWYQQSIETGDVRAYTRIGLLYKHGLGVSKNLHYAFECLKKGANTPTEDPICHYELAYFYETQESFKDKQLAIKWYTKASQQGYQKAKEALGRLKVEQEDEEKRKRELHSRNSDTVTVQSDEHLMTFLSKKFDTLELRIGELEKASAEKDIKIREKDLIITELKEMLARCNKENKRPLQKQQASNNNANENITTDSNSNVFNRDSDSISNHENDIYYDSDEADFIKK